MRSWNCSVPERTHRWSGSFPAITFALNMLPVVESSHPGE